MKPVVPDEHPKSGQGNIIFSVEKSSFFNSLKTIYSNRNIKVLTVSHLFSAFSFRLWMPYWSLYALGLGANKEMLGLLSMVQACALLLLQLPGGILADRLGRKRLIVFSAIFDILTPFLYLMANSWAFLALGAISQAISWSCMPAMNAMIIESLPEDQIGSGLGVFKLLTWLPRMVMEFLGGVLLDRMGLLPGFKGMLTWTTMVSIFILVIRVRGLNETLVKNPKVKTESRRSIFSNLPRSIIALILVGGISSFAHRMTMPFLVVYAVEVVGLSKTQWGFISMVTGILTVVLGTWGGVLTDRIGRKPCLLFSRIVEPLSKLGFVIAKGFAQIFSVQAFYSIGAAVGGSLIMKGLMMGGPAWQALVADIVPSSDRGRIMGLMGSAQVLLGLPSSWFGGYLWEHHSPELTFQVSGILGFLPPIILYLFV